MTCGCDSHDFIKNIEIHLNCAKEKKMSLAQDVIDEIERRREDDLEINIMMQSYPAGEFVKSLIIFSLNVLFRCSAVIYNHL